MVLADAQAKIDRFHEAAAQGDKLAEEGSVTDAMDELPDDGLARAYAKGANLTRLVAFVDT
jgi:hypothetical protein